MTGHCLSRPRAHSVPGAGADHKAAVAEVPADKALEFWTKADGWSGPVSLGLVQPVLGHVRGRLRAPLLDGHLHGLPHPLTPQTDALKNSHGDS